MLHILKKNLVMMVKNAVKFGIFVITLENIGTAHVYCTNRGTAHSMCNLRCKTPKEIQLSFLSDSNFDYQFIIKDLAELCEGQFKYLGESTEIHNIFCTNQKIT